jgi:hypothetical protein
LVTSHSIEAFRIVGEILTTLRVSLRAGLEAGFGPRWFETALSRELFERLVARKEREKAVNSFNESYFTLLEYADFLDLQEICMAHPETATFLTAFGGNPKIWQARFLELQSLRDKLAGLRDVNDAEVGFLQHLVRRLAQAVPSDTGASPDRSVWGDRADATANGSTRANTAAPSPGPTAPEPVIQPATVPKVSPAQASPATAVPVAPPPPASAAPSTDMSVPPPVIRPALVPDAARQSATPVQHGEGDGGRVDLDQALADGDDKAVIAALYREVLKLSERIMDSRGPMASPVWDKVTDSAWYARRFATLGLRPVSDFYNLYQAVREQVREGATNQELQFFLQAHAFQQIVLAVGVFFHQNKVA